MVLAKLMVMFWKKNLTSVLVAVLCALGIQSCSTTCGSGVIKEISEYNARNYVGFLASDNLEGREAGSRGGAVAAEYIVSLLTEWGVQPFSAGGYFQPFDVAASSSGGEALLLNNILAVIPGSGEGYVVVGAHYDHVGFFIPVDGDSCYNGADDNASGISAVLQLARAIKFSGVTPRQSIIFAFWDGEERGLLGSRFFVENCSFLSNVSAYMNFDMVGRGPDENPSHLTYFYTASQPQYGDWLKEDFARYDFFFTPDYRPWDNPTGGSDNTFFARAGIPIVWYHTEGHCDYHRPSDSADKINYRKLTDITRAACLCLLRLAGVNP